MSTAVTTDARIRNIEVTADTITAQLVDGRVISVPLAWSWRLSDATPEQRRRFEIIGDGQGVHWPDVDEDISVEGMLHGIPAPRPRVSTAPGERRARKATDLPDSALQPTSRARKTGSKSKKRARAARG